MTGPDNKKGAQNKTWVPFIMNSVTSLLRFALMQQLLALPLIHVVLRSGYVDLHDIHENMHVNISLRFLQNIKFSYYILDLNSLHSAHKVHL